MATKTRPLISLDIFEFVLPKYNQTLYGGRAASSRETPRKRRGSRIAADSFVAMVRDRAARSSPHRDSSLISQSPADAPPDCAANWHAARTVRGARAAATRREAPRRRAARP